MPKEVNILLIEDNPADVRLIVEMTRNDHFNIVNEGKLSDGLKRFENEVFALILLDLTLPDSQGFDTITNTLAIAKNIPIVILTGVGDADLGMKAIQNGAQDYLVKGNFTEDLLVRVIRYAIERCNLKNELEEIRLKHQQKELADELNRNQSHLLAISKGAGPKGYNKLPAIGEIDFKNLKASYKDLVLRYIRAIRYREERPSEKVKEFAKRLTELRFDAAGVVRIHLGFLNEISGQVDLQQEKAFSNDARLVLVETLGNMVDMLQDKLLINEK